MTITESKKGTQLWAYISTLHMYHVLDLSLKFLE